MTSVKSIINSKDISSLCEGDVVEIYPDVNPHSMSCATHALCGPQEGVRVFYQRSAKPQDPTIYESRYDSRHICPGPFGTLAFTGRHTFEVEEYTPDSPEYLGLVLKMNLAGLS